LGAAFAAALKRDFVEIDDDFFALGGDSLRATLLLAEMRECFDVDFSARAFFDLRTVGKIARALPGEPVELDAEPAVRATLEGAWSVVRGAGGPPGALPLRSVGGASAEALGRSLRTFARASSVAPSVFYLGAWLELVACRAPGPVVVDVELAASESGSWTVRGAAARGEGSVDLDVLQRQMMWARAADRGGLRSGTARPFRYDRKGETPVDHEYGLAPPGTIALSILEGRETRFELWATSDAFIDDDLLAAYQQRLSARIEEAGGCT
jgi:acyl carrier protein